MPAPTFRPRRILLADGYVAGLLEYLTARRGDLEYRMVPHASVSADDLEWADTYIGFRWPPVEGWGRVRWIHSIGAGVDGFVFRRALPPSLLLTRSAEDYGPAIGEWCVARALAANQHLLELAEAQHARRWGLADNRDPVLLRGQRVLVFGTGLVGRGIARAFTALGCRVDGLSRTGGPAAEFVRTAPATEFATMVHGADWLVLAAPLTEGTYHFVDRTRLSQCGGAYLMNVGRGAVVDESALPEALAQGWIRGAALDVFEVEPLPESSPLWTLPGVVISPHHSGPSTVAATGDGFLECLSAFERGEVPRWVVAPESGY